LAAITSSSFPAPRELDVQGLRIDAQRLWDSLMETARIGATAKGGICRLTLTDSRTDRTAKNLRGGA